MPLPPGTRLGPYEILALVGAGGMGEVYRARDPRLARDVAVKVLPPAFSANSERMHRFEQEARAAAALNHPNILAVYDVGQHDGSPYIVSEMLDGETLRQKIADGPLGARRAVEYAIQIARGLEAAHEKGIVHRDLKPENLVVTTSDRVKILDFGLAKLVETAPAFAAVSDLPTATPDTVPGMVLGTVGYMAPEQVRGLGVDHRADIFAFGAILHEMLSGQRAFRGDTAIDTMTAILKEDPPDVSDATPHISPALVRIINRCLAKSPSARFQSAADLAFALDALSTGSGTIEAIGSVPRTKGPTGFAWTRATMFALALVAIAVAIALTYGRRPPLNAPVFRTSINIPPEIRAAAVPPSGLALSPDGRGLVFSGVTPDGHRQLWFRPVDGTVRPLPGSDEGMFPFWSPDSRFVAFTAQGKLKKIDVSGGPPVTLCDAPGALDGTWGPLDVILFFARISGKTVIWRVSAAGGTPTPATTLDASVPDNRHVAPFFLPDGRHFLYLAVGSKSGGANDPRAVYVGSLDGQESSKLVLQGGSNAKYWGGYLWFLRRQTLMAQPFDPTRLELTGEALPVAQDLALGGQTGQIGVYSASDAGVLAYLAATPVDVSQLEWFDRAGKQTGVLGDQADYGDIEIAPDGTRLAVSVFDPVRLSRDLWLYDVARNLRTRFTFEPGFELAPVWSPDGGRVAFASGRGINFDISQKPSSGAGEDAVVFSDNSVKNPSSWSLDDRFLLYQSGAGSELSRLWLLPLSGDRKPSPFAPMNFDSSYGRFSPDSRWVAYVSNESGRDEVYVIPFAGAGGKWQVSRTGGSQPRWSRDGKEIFYLAPNNVLMAATVNGQGSAFEVGAITSLFQTRARRDQRYAYDVSPDGKRFLVNSPVGEPASTAIEFVVNWLALLRK